MECALSPERKHSLEIADPSSHHLVEIGVTKKKKIFDELELKEKIMSTKIIFNYEKY